MRLLTLILLSISLFAVPVIAQQDVRIGFLDDIFSSAPDTEEQVTEQQETVKASGQSPYLVTVIQGLDKVTGRISTLKIPLGQQVTFGTIQITSRYCYKTPPEEEPEVKAFLEIEEIATEGEAKDLFTGWMFASSPAVSAMDHAVYDVWVKDCKSPSATVAPETESPSEGVEEGN